MLACFYILIGVDDKEDDWPNGNLQRQMVNLLGRPKEEELTGFATSVTSSYKKFFLLHNATKKVGQIPWFRRIGQDRIRI
jgi:hypothetical protein